MCEKYLYHGVYSSSFYIFHYESHEGIVGLSLNFFKTNHQMLLRYTLLEFKNFKFCLQLGLRYALFMGFQSFLLEQL